MIRKAKAVWRGGGRVRSDKLLTESGVLAEIPLAAHDSNMRRARTLNS
jgi:hypothetical protein